MRNRILSALVIVLAIGLVAQTRTDPPPALDNWQFIWTLHQDETTKLTVEQIHRDGQLREFIRVEQDMSFVQLPPQTAEAIGQALDDVESATEPRAGKVAGLRIAYAVSPDDGFRVQLGGSEMFGFSVVLTREQAVTVRGHLLNAGTLARELSARVTVEP